jgi:hypothetical protein
VHLDQTAMQFKTTQGYNRVAQLEAKLDDIVPNGNNDK